jgi:hypothetical protein
LPDVTTISYASNDESGGSFTGQVSCSIATFGFLHGTRVKDFGEGLVSSRNWNVIIHISAVKVAGTAQGRK